ncbi:MAG: hypothetical protein US42_C0005G0045 [Candidatus Magasanikbacteria bacterium GW2011_GWC2_37_14]|uniref:Fimbrial assembly family protein n=1 Tax=Candidatus Magasanikbacteria bacterium GW2011_GWC2_37_14 TaxID=1619046 RepID=A0A0G0GNT1_9BACT|nr:MAG: hypothetical protein US42_C0005G0045 [Candidatus Magasanikbacteria bacterium GW2011_GWC2_37_14]
MMFPHRLNLLSPEKAQHLKRMVNFQFIKNLLEIILIIISLCGITLLGGQWILEDYFNKIAEQIISISSHYSETNLDIKKINQTINKVEKIQNEYYSWSNKIVIISEKIPQNITLQNLSLDQKNKKLTLQGTALTREDLINLKNQLITIPFLQTADIPPSQLTEKTNLLFSLVVLLK